MSDNKRKNNIINQIVVAVVIALLVGSTAPWWWTEIFPKEDNSTRQPHNTPPTESPETLSQTEYSLPGDAILHFRVIEVQERDLTIQVDYQYNEQHGQKVMVGAWLKGVSSGYTPTFVSSFPDGITQLQMSVNEPGMSTDIDIFLYEWGRPAEPFAQRSFPYQMRFE